MSKKLSFTDSLRRAILDSDLTRYRMSKLTGISQPILSRFVSGERGIRLPKLDTLAVLLGLQVTVTKPPTPAATPAATATATKPKPTPKPATATKPPAKKRSK